MLLFSSRRDDLESLGYIFIYFLKGKLPWQNQRAYRVNYDKNYKRIKELKINTSLADLCEVERVYAILIYALEILKRFHVRVALKNSDCIWSTAGALVLTKSQTTYFFGSYFESF